MAIQLTVLLSSGSLVDIDATLFIQLGIFLLMLVLLKFLLFNPVIALIEARRAATVDTMTTADALQKEAKALKAAFDAKLDEVRTEASAERAAAIAQAREKEREALDLAKQRAEEMTATMRADAAAKISEVQTQLESDVRETASLLVERILQRKL